MDCFFCSKALVSEDFPTFGIPTIAKRIPSSLSSFIFASFKFNCAKILSSKSPVSLPFNADTGIIGSIPNSKKPLICLLESRSSHLFTTIIDFLPDSLTN